MNEKSHSNKSLLWSRTDLGHGFWEQQPRSAFLRRVTAMLLGAVAAGANRVVAANDTLGGQPEPDSTIIRWDVVTIGNLSRNRCVDFALSARSMNKLAAAADIIVPGHDNFFLNGRHSGRSPR